MPSNLFVRPIAVLFLVAGLLLPTNAFAQAKAGARCTTVYGALLMRTASGGWESVAAKSEVPAERLVVALFGAEFRSLNDAVEARMVADLGQRGPFPVLEAGLRFHANASADLDATIERGILVLINKKKSGAAHVKLRVRDEIFDLTLNEPKAKVGIEIYGRHVPGSPKLNDAKADDPVANLAIFALEGEAVIGNGKQVTRLHQPPGAALYMWDNVTRTSEVQRFETLPDSVKPFTPAERKHFEMMCACTKGLAEQPDQLAKTLAVGLRAADAGHRKVSVVSLGALDQLPQLVHALDDKEHADVRETAILVLRHWLGREPGQSGKLYQLMTKGENYTPVQAKNFLHMLYGIDEAKRREPATYYLLIQCLNHSKMPMRVLAHWHLVRLVPDGRSIPYDAAAAEPARLESIAAWRRLVPEGELPPAPKSKTPAN